MKKYDKTYEVQDFTLSTRVLTRQVTDSMFLSGNMSVKG